VGVGGVPVWTCGGEEDLLFLTRIQVRLRAHPTFNLITVS